MGLTGPKQLFPADGLTGADTTATSPVGTQGAGDAGEEYVYLRANGAVAANDVCVYDVLFDAAPIAANDSGPVAVALATLADNEYGWFQIGGVATAKSAATGAGAAYITATGGEISESAVAGDWVAGMEIAAAAAGGTSSVVLNRPQCYDGAYLT